MLYSSYIMQPDKKSILKKSIASVSMQDTGHKVKDYGCCEPIASKKSKKEKVIYPCLYLDGAEAPYLDDCEVGEKYSFLVEGVIRSKSSSEGIDRKEISNYTLEIRKIGKV